MLEDYYNLCLQIYQTYNCSVLWHWTSVSYQYVIHAVTLYWHLPSACYIDLHWVCTHTQFWPFSMIAGYANIANPPNNKEVRVGFLIIAALLKIVHPGMLKTHRTFFCCCAYPQQALGAVLPSCPSWSTLRTNLCCWG